MMAAFSRSSWRFSLSLIAVIATAACAGNGSPTSPSRLAAEADTSAAASSSQAQTSAKPQAGTAGTIFVEVMPGVFGFASGTLNGEPGRNVQLTGDVVGINFEAGTYEALACGTPVVATDVGAVRQMIISAQHGFIVPVDDARRLRRGCARCSRALGTMPRFRRMEGRARGNALPRTSSTR